MIQIPFSEESSVIKWGKIQNAVLRVDRGHKAERGGWVHVPPDQWGKHRHWMWNHLVTSYWFKWFQECLLGRAEGCDIRIQLPIVSKEHAKLKVQVTDGAVSLVFSELFPQLNNILSSGPDHRPEQDQQYQAEWIGHQQRCPRPLVSGGHVHDWGQTLQVLQGIKTFP